MRILQLCKKFPFPLRDGETIAVTYLSKALSELGCEITLLSMNTTKHYTDIGKLPPEFNHYKNIYTTELDNSLSLVDAVKNLFSSESYHVSRYVDDEYKKKLTQILDSEKFDVIQLETLYLAPYVDLIKEHSNALITMRAHNVEFEIWERITNKTKPSLKKLYLNHLTKKLKNFELEQLNKYDYLIPVSHRDLKTFKKLGYRNGAMTSPIGLETANYLKIPPKSLSKNAFSIGFIGALDWMPNFQGLEWLLKNVWPKVEQIHPSVKLNIAGRNTPNWIMNIKRDNVHIHGEVNDAVAFMRDNDVMVVPLFSGSGMRVKILEGMALGKTVITTTLGLEGIEARNGKEILIADTPDEFASRIKYCLDNPEEIRLIGERAKSFVITYYDNKKNAEKLLDIYKRLLHSPEYHLT